MSGKLARSSVKPQQLIICLFGLPCVCKRLQDSSWLLNPAVYTSVFYWPLSKTCFTVCVLLFVQIERSYLACVCWVCTNVSIELNINYANASLPSHSHARSSSWKLMSPFVKHGAVSSSGFDHWSPLIWTELSFQAALQSVYSGNMLTWKQNEIIKVSADGSYELKA